MMLRQKNYRSLLVLAILLCCKIGSVFAELVSSPNDARRHLTETAINPFMDTVCSDMIDDSALQIPVKEVSVVIVARNEGQNSLSRTVSHDRFHIFKVH